MTSEEREKYLQLGFIINEQNVLERYTGTAKTVHIPEGVTEIGSSAFKRCNITKVTVPSSVKRIRFWGFTNCEKLKEVKLSDGLEEIDEAVFFYCDKLRSLNIPKSVKKIGARSFRFCKKLSNIELPDNLYEITDICFDQTGLETLIIPRKVVRIGLLSLSCPKLSMVVLPPNLQEISERAFIGCEKLEQVYIPASLKKLDKQAFDMCYLKAINYEGTEEQWNEIDKGTDDYSQIITFNAPYNYDEMVASALQKMNSICGDNTTTKQSATVGKQQSSTANKQNEPAPAKQTLQSKKKSTVDQHNIADANTKVTINSDIVVCVPEGMVYSTNQEEISNEVAKRNLVFYKDVQNEYYLSEHRAEEYDFANPYAAPQSLMLKIDFEDIFKNIDVDFDLNNLAILSSIKDLVKKYFFIMDDDVKIVTESAEILIYFARNSLTDRMYHYAIVTRKAIYNGQIWMNDIADYKERVKTLRTWLKGVVALSVNKKASAPVLQEQSTFAIPTFGNKRTSMGELSIAVPDGMMTLNEFDNAKGHNLSSKKEDFALLIVPQGELDTFDNYMDEICSVYCQNQAINRYNFSSIWSKSEAEIKSYLIQMMTREFEVDEDEIIYQLLSDKLAVTILPLKDGVDEGKFWCCYRIACFTESNMYLAGAYFNAKEDRATFVEFLKKLAGTIQYKSTNEKVQFEKDRLKSELGDLASENGKIDAVKVSSLLARDIVFWEKEDILFDGTHHAIKQFRFNSKMKDNYQSIFNTGVFLESNNVVAFVEQNTNLVIPTKFYCSEFCTIYNDEPMTGMTALQLCMDHFLEIAERTPDNYFVAMDVHLLNGIPECYKYIGELIKTLRLYNGKTGEFKYFVTIVKTMEVAFIPSCSPVLGAAKDGENKVITVKENESPYARVIEMLEKNIKK